MTTSTNPLAHAEFRKLFTAQVTALIGTGLSTVALALLAFELAGDGAGPLLGMVLAVKMIAYVTIAPLAGAFAHRAPRKTLLVVFDLLRALLVLAMVFVTAIWQIFALIFLLNAISAGFKPVFAATIPDLLSDEDTYTRALSFSRVAYDLENLISPAIAAFALLYFTFDTLFALNAAAFLISALLVILTRLPPVPAATSATGNLLDDTTFGIRAYLKTPRLQGMLCLYVGVALTSAMLIVNTVVYVRAALGETDVAVSIAMMASGGGALAGALLVPQILRRWSDRRLMITAVLVCAAAMALLATSPSFAGLLVIWALAGFGLSLVQTPSGRVVNRSSAPADRPAYFAAQFSLSHACWLLAYPLVGFLGATLGIPASGVIIAVLVCFTALLAQQRWPSPDLTTLRHRHEALQHSHLHGHDSHHQHPDDGERVHEHLHEHPAQEHEHAFVIDRHHWQWPRPG